MPVVCSGAWLDPNPKSPCPPQRPPKPCPPGVVMQTGPPAGCPLPPLYWGGVRGGATPQCPPPIAVVHAPTAVPQRPLAAPPQLAPPPRCQGDGRGSAGRRRAGRGAGEGDFFGGGQEQRPPRSGFPTLPERKSPPPTGNPPRKSSPASCGPPQTPFPHLSLIPPPQNPLPIL